MTALVLKTMNKADFMNQADQNQRICSCRFFSCERPPSRRGFLWQRLVLSHGRRLYGNVPVDEVTVLVDELIRDWPTQTCLIVLFFLLLVSAGYMPAFMPFLLTGLKAVQAQSPALSRCACGLTSCTAIGAQIQPLRSDNERDNGVFVLTVCAPR
jgi:hypothetical protein